jgi:hypothetical protein
MMKLNEESIQKIMDNPEEAMKAFRKSLAYHSSNMSYAYKNIEKTHSVELSEVAKWMGSKLSDTYKRSRKNNISFNLTQQDLVKLYLEQRGRCKLTGVIMQCECGTVEEKGMLNISIDRIQNHRGYLPDNIRLVTHWANNAKSTYTDDEFNLMIKSAFECMNNSNV